MNIKVQRNKFWWVKQWGYESSAYLFDFLDPLLRNEVVKEFESVWNALKAFPAVNSSNPDPFDFKKLITEKGATLTTSQQKMIKKFTENYDSSSYSISATLPQIESAIISWKWPTNPGDPTYFRRFIQKYDMNYDGRLNPREFILASLYQNKQTVGSSLCEYCYFEPGKTLDAIFLYLDCNNDGLLTSEEIWNNLPKINRKTSKWNIFSFGNDQSIRTASVNDFILKNGNTKDGYITRSEFRAGLLLGFWDRQTDVSKILTDDSRTLKNLRWEEGDMIDIALYNYHKKKMKAGLIK
jgi:Ca2+-binding EF-hand superfamily protein